AALRLLRRQFHDGVAGPAELERAGLLEVLALEEQRPPRQAVERRAGGDGRAVGPPLDASGRLVDGGQARGISRHCRPCAVCPQPLTAKTLYLLAWVRGLGANKSPGRWLARRVWLALAGAILLR